MNKQEPRELWIDIKGYDGDYQISSHGRIKSLKWGNEKILTPEKHNSGYLRIKLTKNSKSKAYLIHRLVGIYFVDNTKNKKFINHKDGNKHNNYYKNLEWVTKSENAQHSFNNGFQKPLFGINNPNSTKVNQYDLNWNYIKTFNTIKQASKEVNGAHPNISKACQGKRKTAYGYKWKYANE